MASNESTGLWDHLKRRKRDRSRSPVRTSHLGDLLAPPAVTRSPSPALSHTSSRSTTAQLVSHLALGETNDASEPPSHSVLVTPDIFPTTSAGPSTRPIRKKARTAWTGLETALRTLEIGAGAFPPLKLAVSDFASCLDIVKAAAENRKDYDELASELETMIDLLNKYAKELGPEDLNENDSVANITRSITNEVEYIKKKQNRSKTKRILESAQDKEDVMECYRRIRASFGRLQNNVLLWAVQKINKQDEVNLLQSLSPEEDARYNSSYSIAIKRRGCTAKTREKIQSDLQDWVGDPNAAKIYWMNGMAGTGKTTIAYSLCEWLERNKQLGANFFCSRTKGSCRDVSRIVPTIACQLARYSPAFRLELCKVLEGDRGVSKLDMAHQFENLVKGPLSEVKDAFPEGVVVVIDALDECEDNYGVQLILATLIRFATFLPIKFFVASRPEPAVCEKMSSSSDYSPAVLHLHEIEESIVEGDIRKYMKEEFHSITPPPSSDQIEALAKQAGKLFIYAATVIRFILPGNNAAVNPSARLRAMLTTDSQLTHSSRSAQKYKELDKLYTTIIAAAFNELLEEEEEAIRLVLWTAICAKEPMNVGALASLLAFSQEQVLSALQPLRSVLHVSEDEGLVSTLHASFPDYLLDRLRSGEFYCDKARHNHLLSDRCFELMKEQLCFNICDLKSSFVADHRVSGLEMKIQQRISSALFYACRYWSDHLQLGNVSNLLCEKLVEFLSRRLLFWMEVLNLKRCIGIGVSILRQAQGWLPTKNELDDMRKLVTDAQDFAARFAASKCVYSTPHIYISALPLCPKASSVYMHYWGRTSGLIDMKGTAINSLAQTAIAVWTIHSHITTAVFSPDGTRIASGCIEGVIRVCDSRTGHIVAQTSNGFGYGPPIHTIAFSADGARIVSSSGQPSTNGAIHVWDAGTGDLLAGPFKEHKGPVNAIAFSLDGSRLVSRSQDGTIQLWNAWTGEIATEPSKEHKGPASSIAFSPNGNHIVPSSCAGSAWSYNYTTCICDEQFGTTDVDCFRSNRSVAISPDGSRIVSGSDDGTIHVWDAETGETIIEPFEGHLGPVRSVSFSHDGTRIASGSGDDNPFSPRGHTICVWDALTGKTIVGPFEGHTDKVNSVSFSPDGSRVISGSSDGTIRLWNARTSVNNLKPIKGHTEPVNSVTFSPDGAHILSSSNDGSVRLWDAGTGDITLIPFQDYTSRVELAVFSSDGRIASVYSDNERASHVYISKVWDARSADTVAIGALNTPLNTYATGPVAFSPDGARIVSSAINGSLQLWDTGDSGSYPRAFKGCAKDISSVAFSPDGTRIATGSLDGIIQIWDAWSCKAIIGPLEDHTHSGRPTSYSPVDDRIYTRPGSGSDIIQSWNAWAGGCDVTSLNKLIESIGSVTFSPDGARLASGSSSGTIHVWDAWTSDLLVGPLKEGEELIHINSIVFSSDGARIVSGSDWGVIIVWDAWTGNIVAGPFMFQTSYKSCSFGSAALSPDGNHIVSGYADGTIRVWNVHASTSTDGISAWRGILVGNPEHDELYRDWTFTPEGWLVSKGALLLWLPPDLHSCFPLPLHPLAIGSEGSIRVENWDDLLLGERWSLCYNSEEAQ